jgi:hypothetical protein
MKFRRKNYNFKEMMIKVSNLKIIRSKNDRRHIRSKIR